MIKQIAGGFLQWLLLLVFLCSVMFFCNSFIALALAVVILILPLLTFLLNLWMKRQIHTTLSAKAGCSKKEKISGSIVIENTGILTVAKIICRIVIKNQMTGACQELLLPMSAVPKGKTKKEFCICSEHCGYLEAAVDKIWLMDWFGMLPLKVQQNVKIHVSVLPDTFLPNVFVNMSMAEKEDSENWSPVKKGNDPSEVFALRDYIPGDSLKTIHWKMSAKKGQMIVKEASLPIEKSLLIYWDKNTAPCSAKEMDAMAECVASVSQAISGQGISYVLGWTEGNHQMFEVVDTDDQLLQAIPRMLKHGADTTSLHKESMGHGEYSKMIYFAKTIPEQLEQFSCLNRTMILCGQNAGDGTENIITFRADNYVEDLEYIEV